MCQLCRQPACRNRLVYDTPAKCREGCGIEFPTEACSAAHVCGQRRVCSDCRRVLNAECFTKEGKHRNWSLSLSRPLSHPKPSLASSGERYCCECRRLVKTGAHEFCFLSKCQFKPEHFVGRSLLATFDFETVSPCRVKPLVIVVCNTFS